YFVPILPPHPPSTLFPYTTLFRSCLLWLRTKHVERFEPAVQDCSRSLEPEPAGNHCRVDAAKIGRVDQIVPFVELGQARNLAVRSEEHTSELQSRSDLVCRLLLEK